LSTQKNIALKPLLRKIANHAVFGDISPVGQIRLTGDIMLRHNSGFKLTIVNKGSAIQLAVPILTINPAYVIFSKNADR
jgi:hypothetical protein